MLSSNGPQMFFVGLVLIWDTQQQPRTIQIITGLILRPKMGRNSPESNLQCGLDICLKNVKKGLFYSEYDSLYLHKRKTSFSGHINAISLHVCLGYDFWSVFLPSIWKNSWSFSTIEKTIDWTWNHKSASQHQNLHFQEHSPDLIWI
jgi:hypothetical protein